MDNILKSQKRLKKYNTNRFVAWLLAVLMLFSSLPIGSMTVHAESSDTQVVYYEEDFEGTKTTYDNRTNHAQKVKLGENTVLNVRADDVAYRVDPYWAGNGDRDLSGKKVVYEFELIPNGIGNLNVDLRSTNSGTQLSRICTITNNVMTFHKYDGDITLTNGETYKIAVVNDYASGTRDIYVNNERLTQGTEITNWKNISAAAMTDHIRFQYGSKTTVDFSLDNIKVYEGEMPDGYVEVVPTPVISIDTQPAAAEVKVGEKATLTVAASATENAEVTYQWYSCADADKTNAEAISDATSATYEVTPAEAGTTYYYCTVSAEGAESVDSNVVAVTATAEVIDTQVVYYEEGFEGEKKTYSVTYGTVTKVTSGENTVLNVTTDADGKYRLNIWKDSGDRDLSGKKVVYEFDLIPNGIGKLNVNLRSSNPGTQYSTICSVNDNVLTFHKYDGSITLTNGETYKIAVVNDYASGTRDIYVNNERLTKGTEITNWKNISAAAMTDHIRFHYDSATTADFSLDNIKVYEGEMPDGYVAPTPVISIDTQPAAAEVKVGEKATLTVAASATENAEVTYQWYSCADADKANAEAISDATSATYEVTPAEAGTTYYYCTVSAEGAESVDSNVVAVTATVPTPVISIDTQPAAAEVKVGEKATLTVAASATENAEVTYQWYSCADADKTNAEAISDATSATYEVTPAEAGTTYYYCTVSAEGAESVESNVVAVTATAEVIDTQVVYYEEGFEGTKNTYTVTSGTVTKVTSGENTVLNVTSTDAQYRLNIWKDSGDRDLSGKKVVYEFELIPNGIGTLNVNLRSSNSGTKYSTICSVNDNVLTFHKYDGSITLTNGETYKIAVVNDYASGTRDIYVNNERLTKGTEITNWKNISVAAMTDHIRFHCDAATTVDFSLDNIKVYEGEMPDGYVAPTPVISIDTQPAAAEVKVGEKATLTVAASATENAEVTYQWYSCADADKANAEAISDATSATYEVTPAEAGTTYYYCTVSAEGAESVESNVVAVTAKVTDVAQVGNQNYTSLQDAINAAGANSEIKLLEDIDLGTEEIELFSGVLNLNGKELTVKTVSIVPGAKIVDDSDGNAGVLKCETLNSALISSTDAQVPVYDESKAGYVFADMKKQETGGTVTDDVFNLIFKPSFGAEINNTLLADGGSAEKIVIGLRLKWTKDGTPTSQDLVYADALVQQVYGEKKAFYINASGVNNFKDLTITPLVKSGANIEWLGTTYTVTEEETDTLVVYYEEDFEGTKTSYAVNNNNNPYITSAAKVTSDENTALNVTSTDAQYRLNIWKDSGDRDLSGKKVVYEFDLIPNGIGTLNVNLRSSNPGTQYSTICSVKDNVLTFHKYDGSITLTNGETYKIAVVNDYASGTRDIYVNNERLTQGTEITNWKNISAAAMTDHIRFHYDSATTVDFSLDNIRVYEGDSPITPQ